MANNGHQKHPYSQNTHQAAPVRSVTTSSESPVSIDAVAPAGLLPLTRIAKRLWPPLIWALIVVVLVTAKPETADCEWGTAGRWTRVRSPPSSPGTRRQTHTCKVGRDARPIEHHRRSRARCIDPANVGNARVCRTHKGGAFRWIRPRSRTPKGDAEHRRDQQQPGSHRLYPISSLLPSSSPCPCPLTACTRPMPH